LSERGVIVSWSLKALLAVHISTESIAHPAGSGAVFLLGRACLVELFALAKYQRHFS
jgi:hypothetical protein